ncbi:MAG: gamma-glutamylcyclotransferase [Bdellovibrionia bacterium]
MTTTRFFFYGSMVEGLVHFKLVQAFVQNLSKAQLKGSAYRLKVGYPVVLEQGSDLISGQLAEVKATDLLLGLLDEFHGVNHNDPEKGLHYRKLSQVINEAGQVEEAWVYLLNPKKLPNTATLIERGAWEEAMQSQPPLTQQLTERQVSYIQRLGKSSGREIVPIDLALYRELMNLELIVDKGRRLALSKNGIEVYRYLG